MAGRSLRAALAAQGADTVDGDRVTVQTGADGLEARSVSRTIRTVEDLLRHIEADLDRYEVAASEATKWETATADRATGRAEVVELFRVFVRLRPRGGPQARELVEAMIEAAATRLRAAGRPQKAAGRRRGRPGPWAVLVIADTHFGKYAWARSTGEADYDLGIASQLVGDSVAELVGIAAGYGPARFTVAGLGDLFHYDTPAGTTTSGTPLERDGRLQKMLADGTTAILGAVEAAAGVCPADFLVVNGNHDETLTWALHRIAVERFAGRSGVTVDGSYTPRRYLAHDGNLLGFAHGHRAKRRLPQLMALEAAAAWSASPYREVHTGHLHHQAAEWSRPIETIDGVLVRIAPSLGPADDWHAEHGFVGSRRAMELFIYRPGGGLQAMHVAGPPLTIRGGP